uniref:Uncharacterized protein n=1 Tax=Imasa heleensis TaxID=2772037 RepID=A0A893DCU7_9EUKA|nr:hypothetical protein K8K73_mgp10 [Imasa heleensis]QRR29761.1 hypothetical protein [Imasa heleensis]
MNRFIFSVSFLVLVLVVAIIVTSNVYSSWIYGVYVDIFSMNILDREMLYITNRLSHLLYRFILYSSNNIDSNIATLLFSKYVDHSLTYIIYEMLDWTEYEELLYNKI